MLGRLVDDEGIALPIRVKKTVSMFDRMKGLLFHKTLPHDEALWIEPCNSIHTFFMSFPIDAVFLNRSGEVIKISRNMSAWRMSASLKATAVVEFFAGGVDMLGIECGKQYSWEKQ